ncbi:ribbon-helix-helix domain-containing protein [Thalassomonas actiniarum]|uniref:Antitoxin ParD n=1 Tax=Thalassomonas actiniarum TaxID=485447 RepID=A0AAE9YY45_9GAMM|nr:type II toxin-antitoxin system ParD family antitoxin [Thalassomonas actiniarum]WDE01658.1 type II toxin-antitoxin system ParD family antitoxin [Thalassomonas actiniarum]
MQISLPLELEAKIKAKVESGLYDDAGEVIREALRFMDSHEKWLSEVKLSRLREQMLPALNQLNSGKGLELSTEQALTAFFQELQDSASINDG